MLGGEKKRNALSTKGGVTVLRSLSIFNPFLLLCRILQLAGSLLIFTFPFTGGRTVYSKIYRRVWTACPQMRRYFGIVQNSHLRD